MKRKVLTKVKTLLKEKASEEFLLHIGKLFCSKAPSRKRQPQFNISTLRSQALQSGSSEERTKCQTCKANKTKVTCCSCHKFVCGKCSSPLCNSCSVPLRQSDEREFLSQHFQLLLLHISIKNVHRHYVFFVVGQLTHRSFMYKH